jgi:hypothetical protein
LTERRAEHVMGMPVEVDVRDDGAGGDAIDEVFAWLRFVVKGWAGRDVGRYERGEHIADPLTAMGERGPAWTARLRGFGAMTILEGDRVLSTRRLRRHRLLLAPAR